MSGSDKVTWGLVLSTCGCAALFWGSVLNMGYLLNIGYLLNLMYFGVFLGIPLVFAGIPFIVWGGIWICQGHFQTQQGGLTAGSREDIGGDGSTRKVQTAAD